MPSQSLQDIVANLQTVGIALRPELAPYNIPLSPPGLSTPSHAPPQKPPPSANLETSVEPVKSLSQVSVDEKLNLSNKPKSSDKKATDRSEKKAAPEKKAATEKKLSDKPELEKQEKKEKKTPNAPSEAPVVPVKGKGSQNGPQTAPGKVENNMNSTDSNRKRKYPRTIKKSHPPNLLQHFLQKSHFLKERILVENQLLLQAKLPKPQRRQPNQHLHQSSRHHPD